MPTAEAPVRSNRSRSAPRGTRLVAVAASLAIALVYGLIYLGVFSVGRAEAGELGVLGVAALVFVGLAALLWWTTSRIVWAAAALLQVIVAGMYVRVGAERDPAFEIWGITIRALSLILFIALVLLLVDAWRYRTSS